MPDAGWIRPQVRVQFGLNAEQTWCRSSRALSAGFHLNFEAITGVGFWCCCKCDLVTWVLGLHVSLLLKAFGFRVQGCLENGSSLPLFGTIIWMCQELIVGVLKTVVSGIGSTQRHPLTHKIGFVSAWQPPRVLQRKIPDLHPQGTADDVCLWATLYARNGVWVRGCHEAESNEEKCLYWMSARHSVNEGSKFSKAAGAIQRAAKLWKTHFSVLIPFPNLGDYMPWLWSILLETRWQSPKPPGRDAPIRPSTSNSRLHKSCAAQGGDTTHRVLSYLLSGVGGSFICGCLVRRRFANNKNKLKHLARFARIASSLRFALKFAWFASSPRYYPIFWKVDSQKEGFFEERIDSQRIFSIRVRIANRFARIGPLSMDASTKVFEGVREVRCERVSPHLG